MGSVGATYFECVFVVLVIHKARRLRRFMLSSLALPTVPYFWTLSHKGHDFGGKKLLKIKRVFWFSLQLLSETFLFLRRIQRVTIISERWSLCKVPFILVIF